MEDSKKLAKEILHGDYDFQAEEDKLNAILYELLSRTEKHSF